MWHVRLPYQYLLLRHKALCPVVWRLKKKFFEISFFKNFITQLGIKETTQKPIENSTGRDPTWGSVHCQECSPPLNLTMPGLLPWGYTWTNQGSQWNSTHLTFQQMSTDLQCASPCAGDGRPVLGWGCFQKLSGSVLSIRMELNLFTLNKTRREFLV